MTVALTVVALLVMALPWAIVGIRWGRSSPRTLTLAVLVVAVAALLPSPYGLLLVAACAAIGAGALLVRGPRVWDRLLAVVLALFTVVAALSGWHDLTAERVRRSVTGAAP